jgi:hypothetical protein
MGILDYFIGTQQSKYAGIAIFSAIFVICMAILFTNTDVSLSHRIMVIFFVFLMSIIPVGMSLFELTCIVTGSKNKPYNMCNIFAWVVAVIMIVYSLVLIVSVLFSLFTYKKAIYKLEMDNSSKIVTSEDADKIAKNILEEETNKSPQEKRIKQHDQVTNVEVPVVTQEIGGFDNEGSFMELDNSENHVDNKMLKEHFKPSEKEEVGPEPFSVDSDSFATL